MRADVRWSEIPGRGGGAKPYPFVRWLLELLDYEIGDELTPGSGLIAAYAALDTPELPLGDPR